MKLIRSILFLLLALSLSGPAVGQKILTLDQLKQRQKGQEAREVVQPQQEAATVSSPTRTEQESQSMPSAQGTEKKTYATPDMLGQPGPFPADLDFYFLSAAQSTGVTFIAGNPQLLKQPGLANVYFDVSSVQFGKTNFFADYRKVEDNNEVEEILSQATNYFLAQYNMKNKTGLKIAKAKEQVESPYVYVVRLRKLNKGNATGFWLTLSTKEGAASIDGTVELVDVKTGQSLCVFGFNNISGSDHATKKTRIGLAFGDLGSKLGKLVRDKF